MKLQPELASAHCVSARDAFTMKIRETGWWWEDRPVTDRWPVTVPNSNCISKALQHWLLWICGGERGDEIFNWEQMPTPPLPPLPEPNSIHLSMTSSNTAATHWAAAATATREMPVQRETMDDDVRQPGTGTKRSAHRLSRFGNRAAIVFGFIG